MHSNKDLDGVFFLKKWLNHLDPRDAYHGNADQLKIFLGGRIIRVIISDRG